MFISGLILRVAPSTTRTIFIRQKVTDAARIIAVIEWNSNWFIFLEFPKKDSAEFAWAGKSIKVECFL